MESYIIRIYRRDKDAPYNIIGLVEDVELGRKEGLFHNTEELAEILITPLPFYPSRKGRGERGMAGGGEITALNSGCSEERGHRCSMGR